jgi:Flp pilus assembly protein TadG
MMRSTYRPAERRGTVAVEAAIVLPLLLIMMLGIWEVGRIIQVQQILVNSAREGARLAAGGYVNGTPVTSTVVKQSVRDYLQAAGLPSAAVSGAEIELLCLESPGWTDPADALPLDKFQVKVKIPAGAAFESTRWAFVTKITPTSEMEAVVDWVSLNNEKITVNTQLPL